MVDVICANEKNDFAISDDVDQCIESDVDNGKSKACGTRAKYSLTKRIMEKLIENEHFELDTDAEDCK